MDHQIALLIIVHCVFYLEWEKYDILKEAVLILFPTYFEIPV